MVTGADIDTFWRDGVVCLRGLLDPDHVAAMSEPVELQLQLEQMADLTALAGALDPEAGRFLAGIDHWRTAPWFRQFATHTPLAGAVAALLRSTALFLYEDSVLVKEPGALEATEWHQDLGYFHVEGTQLCTTWCPLDPVDEESGAMRFVRGSHRFPETYRPNLFVTRDPIPGTEGDPVPDVDAGDYDVVTFALEPGDITVHHARTLHAAGGNRSTDRRRRAISMRYCGDDARMHFRAGVPRKPQQRDMHDGDRVGSAAHPQVWWTR